MDERKCKNCKHQRGLMKTWCKHRQCWNHSESDICEKFKLDKNTLPTYYEKLIREMTPEKLATSHATGSSCTFCIVEPLGLCEGKTECPDYDTLYAKLNSVVEE